MRALIVYKRSSTFINYAEKAMTQHYAGNLNNRNFFDILLLSDVYNGWNGIFGEDIFAQLKEESTRIASIHQYLNTYQKCWKVLTSHLLNSNPVYTIIVNE